jgi:hypothetical protein
MLMKATSCILLAVALVYSSRAFSDFDCALVFPKGEWVDLLDTDDLGKYFAEYGENDFPKGGWKFERGELTSDGRGSFAHILSRCPLFDFELEFIWVVEKGANSGVKYLIDPLLGPFGFEYQILDDASHPDALNGLNRQSAALYDLYEPSSSKNLFPPGTENHGRIVFNGRNGQHWLNGELVLSYDIESEDFKKRLQRSKFRNVPGIANKKPGHILIQHHGSKVSFRQLRVLPRAAAGQK